MATITRPTSAKRTGQPGSYFYSEYEHAREQQALVRRDRLFEVVPRSLAKSVPVGLVIGLVLAFGVDLPFAFAFGVFALIVVGWSTAVVVLAFGGDGELDNLRENAAAERKTAKIAARLRRYGWTVMHDMEVPNADAVVGHLIIGPGGVLVVASSPSTGTVRYTKKVATVDGEPMTASIERTAFLADQIKSELQAAVPLIKLPVHAVLVMVEANVLWNDGAVNNVTIISLRSLVDWARSRNRRLNPVEVKHVVTAARALFPAFVDRGLGAVTIDRDQWVVLMNLLHDIREHGGDASDMLDRVRAAEAELARQADGLTRLGLGDTDDEAPEDDAGDPPRPTATSESPLPLHGISERETPAGRDGGGLIASFRPVSRGGRARRASGRTGGATTSRPSLAAVRPERETPAPREGDPFTVTRPDTES
jgi:hypothetical protein